MAENVEEDEKIQTSLVESDIHSTLSNQSLHASIPTSIIYAASDITSNGGVGGLRHIPSSTSLRVQWKPGLLISPAASESPRAMQLLLRSPNPNSPAAISTPRRTKRFFAAIPQPVQVNESSGSSSGESKDFEQQSSTYRAESIQLQNSQLPLRDGHQRTRKSRALHVDENATSRQLRADRRFYMRLIGDLQIDKSGLQNEIERQDEDLRQLAQMNEELKEKLYAAVDAVAGYEKQVLQMDKNLRQTREIKSREEDRLRSELSRIRNKLEHAMANDHVSKKQQHDQVLRDAELMRLRRELAVQIQRLATMKEVNNALRRQIAEFDQGIADSRGSHSRQTLEKWAAQRIQRFWRNWTSRQDLLDHSYELDLRSKLSSKRKGNITFTVAQAVNFVIPVFVILGLHSKRQFKSSS